jgi:hypothetical protein
MKASSLKELKTELSTLHPENLIELCIQLAKYKKENKELLSYLLFEAQDEQQYIEQIKEQIDIEFKALNKNTLYLAKKTIRKVLRITNKYIKYSGKKQTEVELLIYFCKKLRRSGLPLHANTVVGNIYLRQYLKIKKTIDGLHEDLQYDYLEEINLLK